MKPKVPPKHRDYTKLRSFLREARAKQHVKDIAKHLKVTPGFVYQVEKGERKPKDSDIGKWASVYGVNHVDVWKCLHRIPMDLVATLKDKPAPSPADPFSQLSEEEKTELLLFLDFVRWKTAQQASKTERSLGLAEAEH